MKHNAPSTMHRPRHRYSCWLAVVGSVLLAFLMGSPAIGDRIVLRNLEVLSDKKVVSLDEDGIQLDNGPLISWDQVERGKLDGERQAIFDRLLKQLGDHLYRIRQRLSTGDYAGLLPHAEAVHERYAGHTSTTAYMVFQALMWARLATGERELALGPYLQAYQCLRATKQTGQTVVLPGPRRLRVDIKTAMTPELPPVWFDAVLAKKAMKSVAQTIAKMPKPRPPGARIYYATLALTAERPEVADRVLSELHELDALKRIVSAQAAFLAGKPAGAVDRLATHWQEMPPQQQPLALYWLGRAQLAANAPDTRQRGLLTLLRIPAVHGQQQPALAAAGLYQAMRALANTGDVRGSIAIRRELLDRYGQTWHAIQVRNASK